VVFKKKSTYEVVYDCFTIFYPQKILVCGHPPCGFPAFHGYINLYLHEPAVLYLYVIYPTQNWIERYNWNLAPTGTVVSDHQLQAATRVKTPMFP